MRKNSRRDARKSVPAPAAYLRLLLRRFATTPELEARLLEGVDFDVVQVQKPAAEVTLFSYETFSENLTRVVGEEWPLDALSVWGTASQGALDVAVRSAATIGEGVEILKRFGHVRGPFLQLGVKRTARATSLTLASNVAMNAPTIRVMSETAILSARAMLATVMDEAMSELEYQFPWKRPAYAERLAAALGGPVKFDQPHCAIVLPSDLCARPSPYADEALLATALGDLERSARRINSEDILTLKIERVFRRRRTGRVSEEEAARELGLSRRTLVRRLADSGVTFRALLDANLKQRARQLIAERTLSRAEMAEALGFHDPTSFSRACRRWFSRGATNE